MFLFVILWITPLLLKETTDPSVLRTVGLFFHHGGIAAKIQKDLHVAFFFIHTIISHDIHSCFQNRFGCDKVEGVSADFLSLMAGLVKSGVCSKAKYDTLYDINILLQ